MLSTRRRAASVPETAATWSRGKLITLLTAALAALVILALGLGLAIYYTLRPGQHTPNDATAPGDGATGTAAPPRASDNGTSVDAVQAGRDALAAQPMPRVDLQASRPGPVSDRDPGQIVLPPATHTGPAGVPSGFAHTPQGALAQLAAIDQTAMQSGSLDGVRAVIAQWAAPGGPTPQSWSAVKAMAEFLDAAGLSGGGSGQLSLVVTPLMGLIKGSIGPDFVIACVDFEFDATITVTQRVADADCQRMLWQDQRWVIGPGSEPANPPSVWPDTDTAIDVGYRDLRRG